MLVLTSHTFFRDTASQSSIFIIKDSERLAFVRYNYVSNVKTHVQLITFLITKLVELRNTLLFFFQVDHTLV